MQLKSLDINGFKSFPDQVRLDFTGGITGVVGPNGSGKSNIADAVRWVFGEQSVKTLRGAKMEDVIFVGSETRKPTGFASVTLTIDNRDRSVAMEEDEVSITRRLYRSGESEYRINGTTVRMRDIIELFMDTGLGRDGYSVIGQGKIADIISTKSADRREVFEEAAGISKFRYRKNEAENQLAKAEENLLRLRDILTELEERIGPLEKESKKAAEFLVYAEEKKTLEISVWYRQINQNKDKLRQQDDAYLLAKGEYENISRECEEIEEEINRIYNDSAMLLSEQDELRRKTAELQQETSVVASQIAVDENNIARNKELLEQWSAESKNYDLGSAELEEKKNEFLRQKDEQDSKKEILRGELDRLQEESAQKAKDSMQLGLDVESVKSRRAALHTQINESRLAGASSHSLMEESERRLDDLKASSPVKEEICRQFEKELAECKDLQAALRENRESLENSKKGYEMKAAGRRDKLASVEHKRQDIR